MAAGLRWTSTVTGLSSTFGLGSSLAFYPDLMLNPFNVGLTCIVNSTSVTYNVEATMDYTGSSVFISTAANWLPNSALTASATSATGNYAFPVSAIRVNVTAGSSTGTVAFTAIQAGGI